MARTALTVQTIPAFGVGADLTFTAADATNDHQFVNDGKTFVVVSNQDASPVTISMVTPASPASLNAAVSKDTTVAATTYAVIGPFKPGAFNHPGALCHLDITSDTSLTFAVVKFQDTP